MHIQYPGKCAFNRIHVPSDTILMRIKYRCPRDVQERRRKRTKPSPDRGRAHGYSYCSGRGQSGQEKRPQKASYALQEGELVFESLRFMNRKCKTPCAITGGNAYPGSTSTSEIALKTWYFLTIRSLVIEDGAAAETRSIHRIVKSVYCLEGPEDWELSQEDGPANTAQNI